MRTNVVIMLAFLVFLVGFFSSQVTLTGQYSRSDSFSSLTNAELADSGHLTIDDCRNIARFSTYNYQSGHLARIEDTDKNPTILSTSQYKSNSYPAFDITGDGKVDFEDVDLCYDSVNELNEFSRSKDARQRPLSAPPACEEGRETCDHNILKRCARDAYGILSWAEVAKPNAGERCRGDRIVSFFCRQGQSTFECFLSL